MTADLARGLVPLLEIDDPVPFRLVLVALIVGWMLFVRLRVFEQVLRVSVLDEACVEKLFWSWMVGLLLSLVSALDWWRVLVSGRVV